MKYNIIVTGSRLTPVKQSEADAMMRELQTTLIRYGFNGHHIRIGEDEPSKIEWINPVHDYGVEMIDSNCLDYYDSYIDFLKSQLD